MSSLPPPTAVPPPPPPVPGWNPLQATSCWPVPPSYAGFWQRFGALMIDSLIVGAVCAVLLVPGGIMLSIGWDEREDSVDALGAVGLIIMLLVIPAVFGLAAWMAWREGTTGQSPGKKAVGIKVWRTDGAGPIGGGKGIGRRAFAYFISGQVVYLGYLWMLWDKPRRQTWHDKVVDAVVVKV